MDDAMLAGRAAAGDLDSFGQLYDRYLPRVHDFAWRTLGDAMEAAAATEEAFTATVAGMARPGNAPSFRALLFANAHKATLARGEAAQGAALAPAGAPAYEEAFGAFDVPDPAQLENPAIVRGDHELAALTWEALAGLTARDYALLDLHLRQGLNAAELAWVLGTPKKDAQTIITRMTRAAEDVVDSHVLARRAGCPQLREALAPFAIPPVGEEARQVASAHIASCDECRETKKRLPSLLGLLPAFAPVAAPLTLKGDVWQTIASAWRLPPAPAEAALFEGQEFGELPASPYAPLPARGDGAPPIYPRGRPAGAGDMPEWMRNKVLLFSAAAIGLLVFAFAGGAVISNALGGGGGGDGGGGSVTDATRPAPGVDLTPGIAGSPGVSLDTATAEPTSETTETATAEASETPEPAAPSATPRPAAPTATSPAAPPTPAVTAPAPTPTRRALVPIGTPGGG